mgnify:CR=1 FL=1
MINSIGYNLRMLRFKHNLTQKQVAEATGISINSISVYENDKRFPKKEEIQKLADFYKADIDEILIGNNRPTSD